MKKRAVFNADNQGIGDGVDFLRNALSALRIRKKKSNKSILIAEEAIASLVDHTAPGEKYSITVRSFLGSVTVKISSKGEEYDMRSVIAGRTSDISGFGHTDDDVGVETEQTLRNIILNAFTDDLKTSYKNGVNTISFTIFRSDQSFLIMTLGAMALGVVAGLALAYIGNKDLNLNLSTYVLNPISTMFMNALKMIVAPVVFFSIISCIVKFTELSELGRIGGKIFGLYAITTTIAIFVSIGVYYIFRPGGTINFAVDAAAVDSIASTELKVSILDTIIGIVPSNIIKPFFESNMLQLIFMAVLSGVAISMIGRHSKILIAFIEACNELFLKITSIIIKVMPLAILCSIMEMMLKMGLETITSVLGILGVYLVGLIIIMVIYCLMLLIFGRINPVSFLKKYSTTMLQVFAMNSSNAAIPINMEACEKKLGIAPKVYSLSIPLGATVNMDGTCIRLGVFSLALAGMYGIEISGSMLFSLVVSIFVLSVGTPGIPGVGIISLSVLLTAMGVPIEAVGIVMGIDSLVGMSSTMSNCLGDVVVSTIVARSEGLLDMNAWK